MEHLRWIYYMRSPLLAAIVFLWFVASPQEIRVMTTNELNKADSFAVASYRKAENKRDEQDRGMGSIQMEW